MKVIIFANCVITTVSIGTARLLLMQLRCLTYLLAMSFCISFIRLQFANLLKSLVMCVRLTKLIFKLAYQDSLQVGLIVAATLDKGGISFEGSTRVGISSRDSEAASITIPGFDRQTEGDLG